MKKALFLLCFSIGLCLFAIAFWPMRTVTAAEIPVLSAEEIDTLTENRVFLPFDLPVFSACGEALPHDNDTSTWYTPALTDDVSANVPRPWRIARTEQDAAGAATVILYNGIAYTVCTVTETGLPVIDIQLRRFDLDPKHLTTERIGANTVILFQNAEGHMERDSSRIEIKVRGGSSRNYEKKSYTLFFPDASEYSTCKSPLGLPADRKYALNSMYEDESKIRDALSYRLWAQMEPDNALQFAYAELLINDSFFGLYGMHGLPTENSLTAVKGDVIYKIENHLFLESSALPDRPPSNTVVYGADPQEDILSAFMDPLFTPTYSFPSVYDRENFTHYAIMLELLVAYDNTFKNMVIIYDAEEQKYRLCAWDMDISFGAVWDESLPRKIGTSYAVVDSKVLYPSVWTSDPLSILYHSCPDFKEDVDARYCELRKTIFTDDALLKEAGQLYDLLTDCGARARDAERWPDSAISENNSFIENFIPARMAFLDAEFGCD